MITQDRFATRPVGFVNLTCHFRVPVSQLAMYQWEIKHVDETVFRYGVGIQA